MNLLIQSRIYRHCTMSFLIYVSIIHKQGFLLKTVEIPDLSILGSLFQRPMSRQNNDIGLAVHQDALVAIAENPAE